MTAEEKVAYRAEAAARNRKRLENYDPVAAARNAWRREFSRSPVVIEMMSDPLTRRHVPNFNKDGSRSTQDGVEHLCRVCSQWKRSRKKSKVAIDHVIPVVDPVAGFADFNTYFARMWCDRANLQKICGDCHQDKTNAERLVKSLSECSTELDAIEANWDTLVQDKKTLRKTLGKFVTPKRKRTAGLEAVVSRAQILRSKLATS